LQASYRRWTGKTLLPPGINGAAAVQWLDTAPFALVSHGPEADPIFNYANHTALHLFAMTWAQFTILPSRLSAGPTDHVTRMRLLERGNRDGYIDGYAGVRIAAGGKRFMIRNTTVWNLLDEKGHYYGQAAMIPEWGDAV